MGLAACSERGELQFSPAVSSGTLHDIWVANFRSDELPAEGQRTPPRPTEVTFQKNVVSVPQTHQPGQIEWPDGAPDPETDFVTVSSTEIGDLNAFAANVIASDTSGQNEIAVFVHGYNLNNAEAVYQLAQIKHDFETPTPTVLFSWPSAGSPAGYIYDRDSALIARDQLEKLIVALTRRPGQKITLLGHSMGSFVIMETLRQIEISGSVDIGRKISGTILLSPDLDGELFQAQAASMKTLPETFVIVVARQDRALRISGFLTGRGNSLGTQTDRSAVGDLPIDVVDVSELSIGGNEHSIGLSSPTAISIFKQLREENLPTENERRTVVTISELAELVTQ
ncbi:alpha/beta hydrolase [Yoonia sp. R2-816]|uniref:alpha/beta hydrolase n=1 Tax=Yoonia sp. R2-816 TaxID=3342638 RepID=UPI00372D3655